ncbi:bifunctional adenosylcobinamide kinase/adenosylcobinamide-phosphate guanylyltransferase [Planotetraspora phitsanulokensis]|uniref:Adenosylcobinamide kinase n=1 Tax=Planotetraspora phitsanulokensis TaxID=575192 RepID=A0A8J3XBN0_9ACTN|nr:bifunctional adenosylcobinamide kinase/adenosylcobinamide-phosphate guanylyltransferase [Planotetraspora phitsanulokensis]GII35227.1 adenosylcobinamide kinase/adenosylcobinamide phosphate guanyltransferase [Planotetraspora phitsanulokensis]
MEVYLEGTAGLEGWPAPGCGCASCGRLSPGHRGPASILLDGRVRLPHPGPGLPEGYGFRRGPDGDEIVTPDGGRLLHAGASRWGGSEPYATEPFDLVLIDLLDRPEHLGDLRRRGLVTPHTRVVAVGVDHRVTSEAELSRRLAFWDAEAVPDGTSLETAAGGLPYEAASPRRGRTLLLGGSRSGKSAEAELRVAADPDVTYVATGPSVGDDPSWLARVQAHRDRRPAHWRTVETTDLAPLLLNPPGTLLIDGLGTWLAAVFDEYGAWPGQSAPADATPVPAGGDSASAGGAPLPADDMPASASDAAISAADRVARRCDDLVAAWRRAPGRVVAVSDEVGLGVVPATASGRLFRDALGRLNQRLAQESEDVALVVAGRVLPLPF